MDDSRRWTVDPGIATLSLAIATVVGALIGIFGAPLVSRSEAAPAAPLSVSTTTVTVTGPAVTIAGPTVTATVTDTSVGSTNGASQPLKSATDGPAQSKSSVALVDVTPIHDGFPWKVKSVDVRSITYPRALVIESFATSEDRTESRHIPLDGRYSQFTGSVAIPDNSSVLDEVLMEIEVDGEIIFEHNQITGDAPKTFDIDVTGAQDLILRGVRARPNGAGLASFLEGKLTLEPQ